MPAPADEEWEAPSEDWLITYADAITLLMAFFVMILTFSEFDIPAYEAAAQAIKAEVGNKEIEDTATESLKLDIEDIVYTIEADRVVNVFFDARGVVIELDGTAFYKPGSAEIRLEALPVLEKIALTLSAPKYTFFNIKIDGHTDDDPISTDKFPSNWELSSGRATALVRYLGSQDLNMVRMQAAGFADTRPKVPNRDQEGKKIPENQATNRRISIRVFQMIFKERKIYDESLKLRYQKEKVES